MKDRLIKSSQALEASLSVVPLVAILRGLRTEEALAVVGALFDAGVRVAEVPLNSPDPFTTIKLIVEHFGEKMMIGAGTVTTVEQVALLAETGAKLCVSPNTNTAVITAAIENGLVPMPGFVTPTEAFTAIAAGARFLKCFPAAERMADLSAMAAVLPRDTLVVAVGGVGAANGAALFAAGARAFGIGSDLFRSGMSEETVRVRADALVAAFDWKRLRPRVSQVCNPRASIGESPLWRDFDSSVLWVDPVRRILLWSDQSGQGVGEIAMDAAVFSLSTLPSGHMVGVTEEGFCAVHQSTGAVRKGPRASQDQGCRFNDMAVDSNGGLWAGSMHRGLLAGRGSLFYAPSVDHASRQVAIGLGVPNGMAFDAGREKLFVVDTLARTLLSYPVDIDKGHVGEPSIVTDFMGIPGKPDGMTIGEDGTLWVAMWGGGCVVQISTDGVLLQLIHVPATHVSSVCFAPNGTLFVTTSRMRLSESQLVTQPGSGALFAINL